MTTEGQVLERRLNASAGSHGAFRSLWSPSRCVSAGNGRTLLEGTDGPEAVLVGELQRVTAAPIRDGVLTSCSDQTGSEPTCCDHERISTPGALRCLNSVCLGVYKRGCVSPVGADLNQVLVLVQDLAQVSSLRLVGVISSSFTFFLLLLQ